MLAIRKATVEVQSHLMATGAMKVPPVPFPDKYRLPVEFRLNFAVATIHHTLLLGGHFL